MSRELLTNDKQHLQLFEDGVSINKNLLKWKRAEQGIEKTEPPKKVVVNDSTTNGTSSNSASYVTFNDASNVFSIGISNGGTPRNPDNEDVDSNMDAGTRWLPLYQTPEGLSFDEIASAGIRDLTRLIVEKKLKYVMAGYGSFGTTTYNGDYHTIYNTFEGEKPYFSPDDTPKKKKGFFARLFSKKEKKVEETYEFDAIKFFSLVKATTKESAFTYKDRVSNYLKALHNSADMGQVALQEELLKGLITNKYESLLYAEGYYYVIDEPTIVDFIKKCEKGLSLDYIKNFTRPIPQSVVDKISKLNELEIFDNYVVLHYDPEKTAYKETEYERAKRKDPIIFGLIAGSKKLYYVTDWIDEYCDLTLEKFVDTLSITKDDLHMDGPSAKKDEDKPKQKKKRTYHHRKNNKKTNRNKQTD
jgi:hypothetical protein